MVTRPRRFRRLRPIAAALLIIAAVITLGRAADHSDGGAELFHLGRLDANITQFYAFITPGPDKLALVLLLNDVISDPQYFFAEDLTVRFHIDNHSEVTFSDGDPASMTDDWMMRFGGTVTEVDKIKDDFTFEITFEPTPDGRTTPRLKFHGLPSPDEADIRVFPADGESPVRRGGSMLALEVPLAWVTHRDHPERPDAETLLLWATTNVPEVHGSLADHMGMPNTSNQAANVIINRLRPRDQAPYIIARPSDLPAGLHLAPYADVLIYHLGRAVQSFPPAQGAPPFNPFLGPFPNGRPVDLALMAQPFVFPYIAP